MLVCAVACRAGPGAPARPLVLGEPTQAALGVISIAAEEGYFDARRVRVERRSFAAGRDAHEALLRGEVDVAACFETPVVLRAGGERRLRVLTTLHRSTRNTAVVARRDRGIASGADLRGKAVGVAPNTNAEFFLRVLLQFHGVDPDDVHTVDVPPGGVAAALRSGAVDAIATWYPHVREAREAFAPGATVTLQSDVYTEMSMLVTTDEVLGRRGPELQALLRGLVRAEELSRLEPARAFAAVARDLRDANEGALRAEWDRVSPRVGLQNLLLALLQRESEWAVSSDRVAGPPPHFADLLAPGPLEAVAPDAVTYLP